MTVTSINQIIIWAIFMFWKCIPQGCEVYRNKEHNQHDTEGIEQIVMSAPIYQPFVRSLAGSLFFVINCYNPAMPSASNKLCYQFMLIIHRLSLFDRYKDRYLLYSSAINPCPRLRRGQVGCHRHRIKIINIMSLMASSPTTDRRIAGWWRGQRK